MIGSILSEKISMFVGLVFSASGFMSLLMLSNKLPLSRMIPRLGFVAAAFSCLWLLTLCWAACFSYIAQNRGWSFRLAGVPLVAGGVLLFFSFLGRNPSYGGALLIAHGSLVPIVARRLALVRFTTGENPAIVAAARTSTLFPN